MSKVYAMWHGGLNYSAPSTYEKHHIEVFASLSDAIAEFRDRQYDSYYPCVTVDTEENGGASMQIFFENPFGYDAYPDKIICYGPRGGVKIYNA